MLDTNLVKGIESVNIAHPVVEVSHFLIVGEGRAQSLVKFLRRGGSASLANPAENPKPVGSCVKNHIERLLLRTKTESEKYLHIVKVCYVFRYNV